MVQTCNQPGCCSSSCTRQSPVPFILGADVDTPASHDVERLLHALRARSRWLASSRELGLTFFQSRQKKHQDVSFTSGPCHSFNRILHVLLAIVGRVLFLALGAMFVKFSSCIRPNFPHRCFWSECKTQDFGFPQTHFSQPVDGGAANITDTLRHFVFVGTLLERQM